MKDNEEKPVMKNSDAQTLYPMVPDAMDNYNKKPLDDQLKSLEECS